MTFTRSFLAATALAAIASAQNNTATITSPPTTLRTAPATANPSIISIMYNDDAIPVDQLMIDGFEIPTGDITLQGSIVTVGPAGTVIDIACPYTMIEGALGDEVCSIMDAISYTVAPGTEQVQFVLKTALEIMGEEASIAVTADNVCTTTGVDAVCEVSGSVWASVAGTTTSTITTTTQTYEDISYTPLTITAGMEKIGGAKATGASNDAEGTGVPESEGAASSFKSGSALFGAAAAFAVAALAL